MFDDLVAEAQKPPFVVRWFAEAQPYLRARWIWLRALGAIFFSAFYSLWFQIHGLIGPRGILPADELLPSVRRAIGLKAYWLIPSLLWIDASDAMLTALVAIGLVASVAIVVNVWPRVAIATAGVCFLSFVTAAQEFSGYQSDSMLLEAALLSIFFAPRGVRPGLGAHDPPTRAAHFLLLWVWFRIYFQSGLVKLMSGDVQWRNLTAMDEYYENGPLPTWLGWHVQHWGHGFHAFTAAATLAVELVVVLLVFVPGRWGRRVVFAIVTPLQVGIILTANYAFLNYLVLALGVLLLDDDLLRRSRVAQTFLSARRQTGMSVAHAAALTTLFLLTIADFLGLPPARWLAPFRIANSYGLFAVMTRDRYEIEFQGTLDGRTWVAYPFRHKPQDVTKAPGIYAPYQPRFEWNLWFASLGPWQSNPWVLNAESRLLERSQPVLRLFARDPFDGKPPIAVRTVLWRYWFTSREERRKTGAWWNRALLGPYAPAVERRQND